MGRTRRKIISQLPSGDSNLLLGFERAPKTLFDLPSSDIRVEPLPATILGATFMRAADTRRFLSTARLFDALRSLILPNPRSGVDHRCIEVNESFRSSCISYTAPLRTGKEG
jgi:hypothetical protein